MENKDSWQRMRELFESVVELSEEERDSALKEVERTEPELAAQVQSLLLSSQEADAQLDGALQSALDSAISAGQSEAHPRGSVVPGQRIGPYLIERELGRGGMGVVFLAQRDDEEYQAKVAVKVLRDSLGSRELESRFKTERQILADLDHPNIARLLDGGSTEDGQPFLVMEYIEGTPLTEYCDRNCLDTSQRLKLFLTICDAVRYAHRNLIVHRDLKPGNILITNDGTAKLLDFGIAKLLVPGTSAHTVAETQVGARLMTPDYASPEQILGESVTTASDIYALGILLYELLTGSLPHTGETLPQAVQRVLAETKPLSPSQALSQFSPAPPAHPAHPAPKARNSEARAADGSEQNPDSETPTLAEVATARSADPQLLRRQLEGDLDHIVLMALRNEPERRYSSVAHLADDISRHLEGLPVSARPSTFLYRTQKFVTRHREAVGISALLALALVALVAFYTNRLQQERAQAQAEASKANQVAEFLTNLFEISDPSRSRGESITARELLDQGAERIDGLAPQPEVQAAMMDVIGNVYRTLALYDEAEPLVKGALELREQLAGGRPSNEVAESLQSLGRLVESQGDGVRAEEVQRKALAHWQSLDHASPVQIAGAFNDLGSTVYGNGDYVAAEEAHRQALATLRTLAEPPATDLAHTLDRIAASIYNQGRYDEGESLYREALEIRQRELGEDSLEVANSYSNIGNLLRYVERYEEAEAAQRKALQIRRKILGPDHPNLTTSLNNLAVLLASQERLEEALPLFEEALRIRIQSLGPRHHRVGVPLTGLADALRRLGRFDEAEKRYRESVVLHKESLSAGHPFIAHPLIGLASTRSSLGDHEEATELLEEALTIRRNALEASHWMIPYTESLLGRQLVHTGNSERGLALLESSLDRLRESLGNDHSHVRAALTRLEEARVQTLP